jgi:hypothetical protein
VDISRNLLRHEKALAVLRIVQYCCAALLVVCLVVLAIRAALRLEGRWDTFMYHLPFAAIYGGVDIPYEINDRLELALQGFPPLVHTVQGLLWRLSGSVNATGVVNYLAFIAYLAICQRKFKTPFYLLAAIAMTAPLVLIHLTVSYVDLFGNSWLAVGLLSLFYAYYFDRTSDRSILCIGLLGLVAAAYCKFQLVPVVAVLLVLYFAVYRPVNFRRDPVHRQVLLWIVAASLVAAVPYIKNWAEFGNPFWPVRVPVFTAQFPFSQKFMDESLISNSPPPLLSSSQSTKFFHSLFEIGHPHEYEHRHRWIIDQGNAWIAFRAGGFWNVSVVTYLLLASVVSIWIRPRKGLVVSLTGLGLLLLLSTFPQSHELRYYLFIPLAWAGVIASIYPEVRRKSPLPALAVLLIVVGLFIHVNLINLPYYRLERIGFADVAHSWGVDRYWPHMRGGVQYCVVDMVPMGMMFTGPTMTEFQVVDRTTREYCPEGSVVIADGDDKTEDGLSPAMRKAVELIYQEKNYPVAVHLLDLVLQANPHHFGALWHRAVALEQSGQYELAVAAWEKATSEAMRSGYTEAAEARARLLSLQRNAIGDSSEKSD